MTKKTISVQITADPESILKIERMLAWMHWNTRWGHSGTVASSFDGDGEASVTVEGIDLERHREKAKRPSGGYRRMFVEWMGSEPDEVESEGKS